MSLVSSGDARFDATVGETGERGVLAAILRELVPSAAAVVGPGDDCAVLRTEGNLVVTTDTMIEAVDFRLDWHTGSDLGWKLAATNLSDVAAMGAVPTALTVAIACPPHTPVGLLVEVARGLTAACAELAPQCGVVGGDLGQAPVMMVAVTAMGDLGERAPVLRSGARAGDTIAYAGQLGLAGVGLRRLFACDPRVPSAEVLADASVRAQLAPRPVISAGPRAAAAGATAMLDVSDGLSFDAARIAAASGVTFDFSSRLLAEHFGVQEGVQLTVTDLLRSGEDHGLLATFAPGAKLPEGFRPIGEVVPCADGVAVRCDGVAFAPQGWDPLQHDVSLG